MIWEDPDRLPAEGVLHPLSPGDLAIMREAYAALLHEPSDDARMAVNEDTRTVRVEHAGVVVMLYARPVRPSDVLIGRAPPGVAPSAVCEGHWCVNDLRKCERHLRSVTMNGG